MYLWVVTLYSRLVCIISFLCAKRLVSKGYLAFLSHLRDDTSKVPSIESVLIVCEFVDVFPADMLGMPLNRDIHFCTNLKSETHPIPFHLTEWPQLS